MRAAGVDASNPAVRATVRCCTGAAGRREVPALTDYPISKDRRGFHKTLDGGCGRSLKLQFQPCSFPGILRVGCRIDVRSRINHLFSVDHHRSMHAMV